MEINYEILEKEIISNLDKQRTLILSTSLNDYVTSRAMSIINIGLDVYFQTNESYIKYDQIQKNPNVALCFNNISIEGVAENIGNWKDAHNKDLLELYKSKHLGSFDAYGLLDGQVVYKVNPDKIKLWKYVNGDPLRETLHVDKKVAERLDFM